MDIIENFTEQKNDTNEKLNEIMTFTMDTIDIIMLLTLAMYGDDGEDDEDVKVGESYLERLNKYFYNKEKSEINYNRIIAHDNLPIKYATVYGNLLMTDI